MVALPYVVEKSDDGDKHFFDPTELCRHILRRVHIRRVQRRKGRGRGVRGQLYISATALLRVVFRTTVHPKTLTCEAEDEDTVLGDYDDDAATTDDNTADTLASHLRVHGP